MKTQTYVTAWQVFFFWGRLISYSKSVSEHGSHETPEDVTESVCFQNKEPNETENFKGLLVFLRSVKNKYLHVYEY